MIIMFSSLYLWPLGSIHINVMPLDSLGQNISFCSRKAVFPPCKKIGNFPLASKNHPEEEEGNSRN